MADLVQTWADDPNVLPAVEIRANDETTTNFYKAFNSSAASSHPPSLHITYNHDPDLPGGLYTSGSAPTITLHGIFSDPDGGTGSVRYTVYDGSGSQVYTGSGSTVSSGSDSPLTPPSSTLQAGYTWKAEGYDGTYYSEVSSAVIYPLEVASSTGPYNVVVFMIDDLDLETFEAATTAVGCDACPPSNGPGGIMPNYCRYFVNDGTAGVPALNFSNAFVSYSLCCPSRASFLTGQYAHNTMVQNNGGTDGGCHAFHVADLDDNDLPTWLKDAHYRTSLVGKYLNGYGSQAGCPAKGGRPVSWDDWHSLLYAGHQGTQYDASYEYQYAVANGDSNIYINKPALGGPYQTEKLADGAVDFINKNQAGKFFLYLAPSAPHLDSEEAAPGAYDCNYGPLDLEHPWGDLPSIPSPHDHDVDQDSYWAGPWGDIADTLKAYEDDMIGQVGQELSDDSLLGNTVMIFTSDNGFFNGEHRLHEKIGPYEEGLRVPLTIRYPGLYSGFTSTTPSDVIVLNSDLAPTIADLTGAKTPLPTTGRAVDGQSLYNYLTSGPTWGTQNIWTRQRFGVEHWTTTGAPTDDIDSAGGDFYCAFQGIRTGATGGTPDPADVLYVHFTGSSLWADCDAGDYPYEYYSLQSDQYETDNQCVPNEGLSCPNQTTSTVDPELQAFSDDFASCYANSAPTCQAVENATSSTPAPYTGLYPPAGPNSHSVAITIAGTGFVGSATYHFCYQAVIATSCTAISGSVPANGDGMFTMTGASFSTGPDPGVGTIEVLDSVNSIVAKAPFAVWP